MPKAKNVAVYIATAPAKARPMLRQIRRLIKKAVPGVEEKISYAIPYYGYFGRLIYFAAFKDHIGVYVMSGARKTLGKALDPYRVTSATLHFPLTKSIPVALLKKIVKAQAKANEEHDHVGYKKGRVNGINAP